MSGAAQHRRLDFRSTDRPGHGRVHAEEQGDGAGGGDKLTGENIRSEGGRKGEQGNKSQVLF